MFPAPRRQLHVGKKNVLIRLRRHLFIRAVQRARLRPHRNVHRRLVQLRPHLCSGHKRLVRLRPHLCSGHRPRVPPKPRRAEQSAPHALRKPHHAALLTLQLPCNRKQPRRRRRTSIRRLFAATARMPAPEPDMHKYLRPDCTAHHVHLQHISAPPRMLIATSWHRRFSP
eukprot:Rmarinus@m.29011